MNNVATRNTRGRYFVFTLNNPPDDDDVRRRFDGLRPDFYCWQRERGATGTLHLQGVICFPNPRTIRGIATGFPIHVEFMRGTLEEAIRYCSKDETREPNTPRVRVGEPPRNVGRPGGRSDLHRVADAVAEGRSLTDISAEFPVQYIRYYRGIAALQGHRAERRSTKTEIFWYYGPTGTGKSRAACDQAPNAYWKDPTNVWWDGYESHEDVIIDDYRAGMCTFSYLLRLFDRYPMQVQCKGGYLNFNAKRIFITSPKNPQDTWMNRTDEEIAQLERRVEHVTRYDNFFNN